MNTSRKAIVSTDGNRELKIDFIKVGELFARPYRNTDKIMASGFC
jgi:hypothetical protein